MEKQVLTKLFERDLDRLITEMEQVPEELMWKAPPGVTNSCGVLAQHLVGNLRHFIGAHLGGTDYQRDREREFTNTGVPAASLIREVRELKDALFHILNDLDQGVWEGDYPEGTPLEGSTRQVLVHLYGHLNYHLGQLNYLRRMLDEKEG
ncbi:MAG: DUF1572 family protein [Balneolaceae bacterium]|nr:DUF1572 family protein [Balneolaceae bacterium]